METEQDNNDYEPQPNYLSSNSSGSGSSSANSSSSNLPMLHMLHDEANSDNDHGSHLADIVNPFDAIASGIDPNVPFNASSSIILDSHVAQAPLVYLVTSPTSASARASVSSSPPTATSSLHILHPLLDQQQQEQQQPQQQHNLSLMQDALSRSPSPTLSYPRNPHSYQRSSAINQLIATTTTSSIFFANAANTEHLHNQQPHSTNINNPPAHPQVSTTPTPPQPPSRSLPSAVYGDDEHSVSGDESENDNFIQVTPSSRGTHNRATDRTTTRTDVIADTIDASAIIVPVHERIDDDRQEVDDGEDDLYENVDTNDVVASTSQQAGARSAAPPTTLPLLLQAAAVTSSATTTTQKAPNSRTGSFYCAQAFAHPQLYSYNSLPPHQPYYGATGNIFNFDTNGTSMYGQGDAPHSSNATGVGTGTSHQHQAQVQQPGTTQPPVVDRLKLLYPNVNENETPLPRCWSPHEKCVTIGLSQNNLRVHYKGTNKSQNDAASVRTAYPIPPACGLYYFEVKIISKGKNGYMGIGLTAQQFRMNRLPGWDKQSYGYHGDDGNSFSSSGNGQTYGPTFTTGDVIGCCVNFVNNTCFYTKNGVDLGIAFRDLPTKLYPTVGLQMPGEEVDANFGQEPFKFERIEEMMKQMREEMKVSITDFPMSHDYGDPTSLLHKMVSTYLVHNGYSRTADAFGRSTGQNFDEEMPSIRNRQKIIKLAMSGKMGQAIEHTLRSYPGLLESNKNLWFMLKCRQFIEMINGSDVEYCPSNKKLTNTTTQTTPPNQTSVIQSTKSYQNGKISTTNSTAVINNDNRQQQQNQPQQQNQQELKNANILADNDNCNTINKSSESLNDDDYPNDVEMENNGHSTNGNSCKNGETNIFNNSHDMDEDMDVDMSPATRKYSHVIERILEFGKELSQMGQQLERENKITDEERQMLEDAFSLIAYSNPWSSPLGWQLCPTRREQVCTALNSAILDSMNYSRRPPLDVCVAHASELLKVMAQSSLGACAFVNIDDVFPQN